jgi:hypothetical protein
MQVATTAPQTSRGFLAVGPDISKVSSVVTLYKVNLGYLKFNLDDIMFEVIQLVYLLNFHFFLR